MRFCYILIHFHISPLRRVAGQQSYEGSKYFIVFSNFRCSSSAGFTPYGSKQGRKYNHAAWYLVDIWAIFTWCHQYNLPCQAFLGHYDHMAELTQLRSLSFGELARHSGLYDFHSCSLCREVSRRELFPKIPSLPFVFEIAQTTSSSKTGNFESVWKLSRFVTTSR